MKKMCILLAAVIGVTTAVVWNNEKTSHQHKSIEQSFMRKCTIHQIWYDLRFGCPSCKAPKFGF